MDHFDTLHDKSNIDLFGTAYSISVDDASFDSALCTAVLEHLEEPELALRECYRAAFPKKGVWPSILHRSSGRHTNRRGISFDTRNMGKKFF